MSTPSVSTPTPHPRAASGGTLPRYIGWSPKLGRELYLSTRLEFLHWLLLESTPEAVQFCEYYPEVRLESRSFVFDMWVRWRDGHEECREVVPNWRYDGLVDFVLRPQEWSVLVSWSREHGYACDLITERELTPHIQRIQNCRRMLSFVRYALDHPDPELEGVILLRLAVADLPLRELIRCYPVEQGITVTALAAKLLHAGKISADLEHSHFGPNLLLKLAA